MATHDTQPKQNSVQEMVNNGVYVGYTFKDKPYLLMSSDEQENCDIEITSGESFALNSNVFWHYQAEGLHKGNPLDVAVKNPRFEPEADEYGVVYVVNHDGLFFLDALDVELPEYFQDAYGDAIREAVREDLNLL